jgi:transposase-like protein
MAEVIKWHLSTALQAGTLTWSSVSDHCIDLLMFDRWLSTLDDPAAVFTNLDNTARLAMSFRRWVSDPENRTRSAIKRSASPPTGHRQVVDLVWCCQDWSVAIAARYKGYRYPIEVIGHAVWLYHRFALSLRDVEELMLARGVVVTYETIRSWCAKFGPDYANQLRRRRPRPGDKWHLDEVFVKINGATHYLWRAVDQHGDVLDILVQSRRNATAAKRFFRKLLKGLRYVPRVLVTDTLGSYGVAHRVVMPSVAHRRSKYLNIHTEFARARPSPR